jgi:hypothetical protein
MREEQRRCLSSSVHVLTLADSALALAFSVLAFEDVVRVATSSPVWLAAYVIGFQVPLGLPLLLIPAATALVEDRARGSLDILLATPL